MIKVVNGRNQIQRLFQLRSRIRKLREMEEKMTSDAMFHLKTYGTLKQDEWMASINIVETRRPKWKDEFVKECGEKKANLVVMNTIPSRCKKLEVYRFGVLAK